MSVSPSYPRIAIAGFMHESNTFNPLRTDRAAFAAHSLTRGAALLDEWRDAHHELGGFIEADGFTPVPIITAWATPSGPVTDDVFDEVTTAIVDGLRRERPDGLLLALHGAMVTESHFDADAEVLARIRAAVGPDFPVVVTLDLHGNIPERLTSLCRAVVAYRTCPHVDQRECGRRAARLMVRHLCAEVRLAQAIAKPPLLVNIMAHDTSEEPLRSIMAAARELETTPGVLAVSVLPGFAYSDVPHVGPSVIVVTDNDMSLAQRHADVIGQRIWDERERLSPHLPDAVTAVRAALASQQTPVVLVDTGDNVGGGSAGDGTILLAELLSQGATDAVVCLYAPDEVTACARVGVGAEATLAVGGRVDRLHGDPVRISGRVRVLHDGDYVEPEVRHGGRRVNHMGLSALVEIAGRNLLVLTSLRHPPFSLGQLTCLGVQPQLQRILVVKAAIAYKAAYLPIAGTVLAVDTPGLTAVNPTRFNYRRLSRPLYPLADVSADG